MPGRWSWLYSRHAAEAVPARSAAAVFIVLWPTLALLSSLLYGAGAAQASIIGFLGAALAAVIVYEQFHTRAGGGVPGIPALNRLVVTLDAVMILVGVVSSGAGIWMEDVAFLGVGIMLVLAGLVLLFLHAIARRV